MRLTAAGVTCNSSAAFAKLLARAAASKARIPLRKGSLRIATIRKTDAEPAITQFADCGQTAQSPGHDDHLRKDRYEPAGDISPVRCDARHFVLVGHLRHGWRIDPHRHPARVAAGARRHDVAWHHTTGLQLLARAPVDQTCTLERCGFIRVRLHNCCHSVVIHPLCTESAGGLAAARFDAVHDSTYAAKLSRR